MLKCLIDASVPEDSESRYFRIKQFFPVPLRSKPPKRHCFDIFNDFIDGVKRQF